MASNKPKLHASLRLDKGLKNRLLAVAADERRTLSQVIRMAVEDWLERKEAVKAQ